MLFGCCNDIIVFCIGLFALSVCYLELNDVFKATRKAEDCLSIRRSIFDPHHHLVAIGQ